MNPQLLIDSVPTLVHSGLPDGYLEFFSQSWLKYAGLSWEDLPGWKWTALIHPDDVDKFLEEWPSALASGTRAVHEARIRRADGGYRWFLVNTVLLLDETDGIVRRYGTGHEIEYRKHAEERVRRHESELLTIIETIPTFIGTALLDGTVDFVSQRWLEHTGLSREEWSGNNRELQNVIVQSVIVCESEEFSVDESWLSSRLRPNR